MSIRFGVCQRNKKGEKLSKSINMVPHFGFYVYVVVVLRRACDYFERLILRICDL